MLDWLLKWVEWLVKQWESDILYGKYLIMYLFFYVIIESKLRSF